MCRHLAWLGAPQTVHDLVVAPPRSLYTQSWAPQQQVHGTVNVDGFGTGWYVGSRPEPVRYRRAQPIWTDPSFASLAPTVSSSCVLAAVRSATPGTSADESASAPFTHDRWLFSHNGRLHDWAAARRGLLLDAADVPDDRPVQHVCWHEADAYARWAGRRLPTEAEWEKAASWDPATGRKGRFPWGDEPPTPERANLGQTRHQPAPAGSFPAGAAPSGALQMIGDVWEWTSTDFAGYPGFSSFPYREYSEVFFGDGYKVLRGGSWATDPLACRTTFRNWDLPIRRQIFAGFRTARDA